MRNDLKDDLNDLPSLTIDRDDLLEEGCLDNHHMTGTTKESGSSKKFWGCILLLLFILYSAGMVGLFWMSKQAAESVRQQLDEKITSTSILTQITSGQLQKIADQLSNQQEATKSSLEALRSQNKQLANKLLELSATQQKIMVKQVSYEKQLEQIQEKVVELAKTITTNDKAKQVEQVINEWITFKKHNLPQTVKGLQDDLLLLRSQLDTSSNQVNSQSLQAFQTKLNQQIKDIQNKLQVIQKQLDNRSPY